MRNSSLVEWRGTDNVARLKQDTEAWDRFLARESDGRGALWAAEKPDRKDGWSAYK